MPKIRKARKGKKMEEAKQETVKIDDAIDVVECGICGCDVDPDTMECTEDGTDMCHKCFTDAGITCKCEDCDGVFCKDEVDFATNQNGEKICESCREKNYWVCSDCDELIDNDDGGMNDIRNGDKQVCDSCFEHDYGACECGYADKENNMTYFGDRWYCNDCYGESLCECELCNHTMYRDDAQYNESDECLCENCYNRENRRVIHDYSYQPDYKFLAMPEEILNGKKPLYLGLELEVESCGGNVNDIAVSLKKWMETEGIANYFYFKTDGSLDHGFEICSMPVSLKFIKKNLKLKKFLGWMQQNGLCSYKKGTCGFHIHMSRNFFRGNEIGKMRAFFSSCYTQIYKFSKRGDSSTYCQKETYGLVQLKENKGQEGRYWALNTNTHKATYEVRVFRGTLRYERVMASIEFVQAISEYVKYVGLGSLFQIGKTHSRIWEDFMLWVKREGRFFQF